MKLKKDGKMLLLEILDRHGEVRTTIDFNSLQLPYELAAVILDCFDALTGQNSVETRRQVWRCIRKFAKFLLEVESNLSLPLAPDILVRFRTWISTQSLGGATCQSHLNEVRRFLLWIYRNSESILHSNTLFNVPSFARDEPKGLPALNREAVKKILAACYVEIDEVKNRLDQGRRILLGENLVEGEKGLHRLLNRLLAVGEGAIPTQKALSGVEGISLKEVSYHGGLRNLWRVIAPSPQDVFPFYLAILTQCSGNPMAIRNMSRDCTRVHPIREDRRSLVWMKERSNREQIADFSVSRPRSAPNIVSELLEINEMLVRHAIPRDKKMLFLAKGNGQPGVPCMQMLHILLDQFIIRHDLPNFDFKQLRKAGAVLHLRVSNDIQVPRVRLNHRSSKTTVPYTMDEEIKQENDRLINRFQGELVGHSLNVNFLEKKRNESCDDLAIDAKNAVTIFGFGCKDPYSGMGPGATPGKMCMKFTSCATCPGAIVVLDDVRVVARLMKTSAELDNARRRATEEGWLQRFAMLYDGVKKIVDEELLGRASPTMLEAASSLVDFVSIPALE